MLDEIHIFILVVKHQSFTKAAHALQLSSATVTRRLMSLEKKLGVKLLKRNTRHFSLTESGHVCYQMYKDLPDTVEQLQNTLSNKLVEPSGEINLSVSVYSGYLELLSKMANFLIQYPKITVNYVKSNIFPDLVDSSYDFYFRYQEISTRSLMSTKLMEHQLIPCASRVYLKNNPLPQHPKDLLTHNCIMHRYNLHEGDHWSFIINGKSQSIAVKGNLILNSSFLVLEAVQNHIGVGYLPRYFFEKGISQGCLVPLLENFLSAPWIVWLVYPRVINRAYKDQLFLDYILSAYANGD